MKNRLIIGSRGSKLALWQAGWVRSRLLEHYKEIEVSVRIIKTSGDLLKNAPLAVIGGKGVFTKELEEALLNHQIDLAVHSLKDLPTILTEGLTIAAIAEREDARDCLVLRKDFAYTNPSIRTLPEGTTIGTSSPRRLAQLKYLRPDIRIKELRGNVDTRLRKLDEGHYDGILLAAAGLLRLGLRDRINAFIAPRDMLPAVSQGALGIESRADELDVTFKLLAVLEHAPTRLACTAERSLLRGLGGGCQFPIAAHASVNGKRLFLDALTAASDGNQVIRETLDGDAKDAELIGQELARRLLARGADSLLAGTTA